MPLNRILLSAALGVSVASVAAAQPTIMSLGSVNPSSVTDNVGGTWNVLGSYLGAPAGAPSAARSTLTGSTLTMTIVPGSQGGGVISANGQSAAVVLVNSPPNQIYGNMASNVSPPFSTTPSLVPVAITATEFCSGMVNLSTGTMQRMGGLPVTPELMVYGSGRNGQGGTPGAFVVANAVSQTGRFVVGRAFISSYNSAAGTTITQSIFLARPYIFDTQVNDGSGQYTVLPTPWRTSTNTWRRREGSAMDASADGQVIVGAQEETWGPAGNGGPDPDGARPLVWRWNSATSQYDMSFLPNGSLANGNFPGQPAIVNAGPTNPMHINPAGTIIVGPAVTNAGALYIAKWVWNAGTSSWNAPISLGSNVAVPALWLPAVVTSCPNPPDRIFATGMTDDGNTVVGTIRYRTCTGFIQGGWIWTPATGMVDWYDYLQARGVQGLAANYGPNGENGNPALGQPKLGQPTGISGDGSAVVGILSSQTADLRATPWIVTMAGAQTCVPPQVTMQPADIAYSHCTGQVILNVAASGTRPVTYQWRRNGVNLVNGPTGTGSTIDVPTQGEPFGATEPQLRLSNPGPADAGSYDCVVTGCSGTTTASVAAAVLSIPAPANNSCATATDVAEGTVNFNMCSEYVPDGFVGCSLGAETGNVWYRYTPNFTGEARFQTCGSGFDSAIQLVDGCNGTVLACNNDVGSRGLVGITCPATRSLISRFPVTYGVPVYVRVSAIGTDSATGTLTISLAPPLPDNDLCANATPVTVGIYPYDLSEATDDFTFGTNLCNGGSGQTQASSNRDVWFRLSASSGWIYSISTCDLSFGHISNTMLHVMTDCSAAHILACHDNASVGVPGCALVQARIDNLPLGGSVLIRVSQSGTVAPSPGGVGTLTITARPACGTADFNCDGDVGTDADISGFFACLSGACPALPCTNSADFNGDGDVGTDGDIEAFFRVLAGGSC